MKKMVSDVSKSFTQGQRVLQEKPDIKDRMYENAILMVKADFKAFKAKRTTHANISIFTVPSSKCEDPTESYYKTLVRATWDSFDEYIVHGFQQFYIVNFSSDAWKTESTCTCADFFKQNMCKHIIAIGIRLKIVEPPDTINPVRLAATKKKSGRPKSAAKALQIQK